MSGTTTLQDSQTRERAGQAKDVAVERSGQVASTAKEQVANVAEETKAQAATLAGQVRDSVRDQSLTQRDRLTGTLHTFAGDLDRMAGSSDAQGPAADLVRQVSTRARSFATSLESREPGELLDGVRDFARRRPGAFLLGAALAGVIAGRATRGARAASNGTTDTTDTYASTTGTPSTAYGYGTASTAGASATPIGDSAAAAVAANQTDPSFRPSPTGTASGSEAYASGIGWDAAEEDPDLGPTNYGGPTGGDVARDVDLREVTGERDLAPVPENSPDDGYGEVLEPDGSGHRSVQ